MKGKLSMRVNECQIRWNMRAASIERVTTASAGRDEVDEKILKHMRLEKAYIVLNDANAGI